MWNYHYVNITPHVHLANKSFIFSKMSTCLADEKVWIDKHVYQEAEIQYYENSFKVRAVLLL